MKCCVVTKKECNNIRNAEMLFCLYLTEISNEEYGLE